MNENEFFLSQDIRLQEGMMRSGWHEIAEAMDFCDKSGNRHLQRFSKIPGRHWEGIVAHGYCRISSGRVEDMNNLIKTVRRQVYGYRDDDYFLKIMKASRRTNTSKRENREAMPLKMP